MIREYLILTYWSSNKSFPALTIRTFICIPWYIDICVRDKAIDVGWCQLTHQTNLNWQLGIGVILKHVRVCTYIHTYTYIYTSTMCMRDLYVTRWLVVYLKIIFYNVVVQKRTSNLVKYVWDRWIQSWYYFFYINKFVKSGIKKCAFTKIYDRRYPLIKRRQPVGFQSVYLV